MLKGLNICCKDRGRWVYEYVSAPLFLASWVALSSSAHRSPRTGMLQAERSPFLYRSPYSDPRLEVPIKIDKRCLSKQNVVSLSGKSWSDFSSSSWLRKEKHAWEELLPNLWLTLGSFLLKLVGRNVSSSFSSFALLMDKGPCLLKFEWGSCSWGDNILIRTTKYDSPLWVFFSLEEDTSLLLIIHQ